MPYDGNGGYQAPANSWNPAVGGTTIDSADWNALLSDLETALSSVITKDGQTTITANLPMAGFKHTGVNTNSGSTSRSEYASGATAQDNVIQDAGLTAGTSTVYTATLTPAIAAYSDKSCYRVQFDQACGDNPTINFNTVGAKKIYKNVVGVGTQLVTGDIQDDFIGILRYDAALDTAAGGFWLINLQQGLSGSIAFSGDISPAQITADQNDYNPTGLSSASTLRLDTDASRTITGLQGGADGRIIIIHNIGSNNLILADENTSSAAANRFAFTTDVVLQTDNGLIIQYDSTSSRWRGLRPFVATQAEQEAATSLSSYGAPGSQQFHPSSIKAWMNLNMSTATLRASYNTTSVTDNGAGDFTQNFTNNFSDANYAPTFGVGDIGGTVVVLGVNQSAAPTASAMRILSLSAGVGPVDIGRAVTQITGTLA